MGKPFTHLFQPFLTHQLALPYLVFATATTISQHNIVPHRLCRQLRIIKNTSFRMRRLGITTGNPNGPTHGQHAAECSGFDMGGQSAKLARQRSSATLWNMYDVRNCAKTASSSRQQQCSPERTRVRRLPLEPIGVSKWNFLEPAVPCLQD